MFDRSELRILTGMLLLVPFLAFAACEGYEDTQMEDQQERVGDQTTGADRPGAVQQDRQQGVEETQQRREAERPDRPAAPTTDADRTMERYSVDLPQNVQLSEGPHELTCQLPAQASQQVGQEEIEITLTGSEQQRSVQLTEDVQLPAGSHELTCELPDEAAEQTGQEEVQLTLTVRDGAQQRPETPQDEPGAGATP